MIGVDRRCYRHILRGNFGGLSLNFDLLIDGTNLENDVFDKRLVRSEGYRRGPGLKAIGTRSQCVGSGGKMGELKAAVRIGHRRLGCWPHGRSRQFHGDSGKAIGGPLPGDYRGPASNRGLGNV